MSTHTYQSNEELDKQKPLNRAYRDIAAHEALLKYYHKIKTKK